MPTTRGYAWLDMTPTHQAVLRGVEAISQAGYRWTAIKVWKVVLTGYQICTHCEAIIAPGDGPCPECQHINPLFDNP